VKYIGLEKGSRNKKFEKLWSACVFRLLCLTQRRWITRK